jgi:hypothetical protein
LLTSSIAAAETGNPDGKVGRPIITLAGDYASATGEPGFYVQDFQNVYGSLSLPISPDVTGSMFGQWHRQDSVRYSFGLRSRLYLFKPASQFDPNPDGPIGQPIIDLEIGIRTSSDPNQKPKAISALQFPFPLSDRITLQASYRYYQSIQIQDVESFSAGLTYYTGPAVADSFLVNPDGAIGYPIFSLKGGGSKFGFFSELTVGSPLNWRMSFYFRARAELLESPYSHNLIAGFGLTWFAP